MRSTLSLVLVGLGISTSTAFTTLASNQSSKLTTHAKMSADAATTTANPTPSLPMPEPICSTEPGTWAYDTMSRRVDEEILQRTYEDIKEDLEAPAFARIKARFDELRGELQFAATRQLTMLDDLPDDASAQRKKEYNEWKQILQPFLDK